MRNSAIARLVVMGGLTILLLIPLTWVWVLVAERASRRDAAVTEVGATWGGPQTIAGPILTVPYTIAWVDSAGHPQRGSGRAHFLPRDVRIQATLAPQTRKRGIFEIVVYRTSIRIDGRFTRPETNWIRPAPDAVDWQNATLSVGISDPKGLTQRVALDFAGQQAPFTGGVGDVGLFSTGIHALVPSADALLERAELPFSLSLELNGTRDIRFMPAADETSVELTAGWPHPSFTGSPLPDHQPTDAEGFTARWRAPDFGRSYAARWTSGETNREQLQAAAQASAFGVGLLQPVDIYHQGERAVKYAVLFIVLTFLVFFMWEIFRTALLHPMQYALVGFALFVFYLLLVSISEHAGFDTAYAISASVTTILIAGYARAVLKGRTQGVSVFVSLTALYGFLYLLLRLEDYALLAGSIGLFLVLTGVMFLTRRMDWYTLRLGMKPDHPAA